MSKIERVKFLARELWEIDNLSAAKLATENRWVVYTFNATHGVDLGQGLTELDAWLDCIKSAVEAS